MTEVKTTAAAMPLQQRLRTSPASDFTGDTVAMYFSRRVIVTIDHAKRFQFEAGVNQVPVELKDHWYLKAHGVKLYVPANNDLQEK